MKCYTSAIERYPSTDCAQEVAVCYSNRAACYLKLVCVWFVQVSVLPSLSLSHTHTHTQEEHKCVVKDTTKGMLQLSH